MRPQKKAEELAKADIGYINLLTDMMALIRTHQSIGGWIVVICPTDKVALTCAQLLSVLIPEGTKFSGRTASLPRGNVSVACVSDAIFPSDSEFFLSFIGWGVENATEEAISWKKKASGIVNIRTL